MKQTWRWFGPHDLVSVNDMLQAGVQGVVTALHHIPTGSLWSVAEIQKRQSQLMRTAGGQNGGLYWDVVESLPVSEDIKRQTGNWRLHIDNYKRSLQNLAACGIEIICYNFMPLLDWTRTDLNFELPNGAKCMRFDLVDFAIFDVNLLQRPNAKTDYSEQSLEQAALRFATMGEAEKTQLASNIVSGLPGAAEGYTLKDLRYELSLYDGIGEASLRQHQIDFLSEVVPVAEACGVRLCCHPDDPPFSLLGLPRIMSTEQDYTDLLQSVDSAANGITLCSGSMGVRADNDLPGMMQRLGSQVHFVHLRNVTRETEGHRISFHEAEHLGGATDMVALIKAILAEEQQRKQSGRSDCTIPFRPDHGQEILGDLAVSGQQPGYPAIGRLKGLAELRGIETALTNTS